MPACSAEGPVCAGFDHGPAVALVIVGRRASLAQLAAIEIIQPPDEVRWRAVHGPAGGERDPPVDTVEQGVAEEAKLKVEQAQMTGRVAIVAGTWIAVGVDQEPLCLFDRRDDGLNFLPHGGWPLGNDGLSCCRNLLVGLGA